MLTRISSSKRKRERFGTCCCIHKQENFEVFEHKKKTVVEVMKKNKSVDDRKTGNRPLSLEPTANL